MKSVETVWTIRLFLTHNESTANCLKAGDVIRLFHAEEETYLTCYGNKCVFLRKTSRADTIAATSSEALWEIEVCFFI